jgi:hypothetical protein
MDRVSDPIRGIINSNPYPAVIIQPAVNNYDPTTDVDYVPPSEPAQTPLLGSLKFDDGAIKDSVTNYSGTLTIHVSDAPADMLEGQTTVLIDGDILNVASIRKHIWQGAVDGYVLVLTS